MQMAWDSLINQGIFTLRTVRGLFLLRSLLHQQLSTVFYHLSPMIQGDQDGCATFTACLYVALQSLGIYLKSEGHLTLISSFSLFHLACWEEEEKEYGSSSTILHGVQPSKEKALNLLSKRAAFKACDV